MRNALGCGVAVGILALTSTAMAQEPTPPPTEPVVTQPPKANATVTTQTTTQTVTNNNAGADKKDDGTTDHSKVIGHFGVGYFGVTAQPIGTGAAGGVGRGTVQVPVIGMRYWLTERFGIDAGLGLNMFSSSSAAETAGREVTVDGPAVLAFALHAGVPLAFATGKHYKFLAIPELNFGYATQTEEAQNVAPGAVAPGDIHRTGLRFDIGARIGTEIQFGFIGIPELALQASVGLNFRRRVWHASQEANAPTTPADISSSQGATDFGTTVQSDPWAIFTNNIAAIYYFP